MLFLKNLVVNNILEKHC